MGEDNKNQAIYSIYGKKYTYNDLEQAYDAGLQDYLSTLNRGGKDAEELMQAGRNLLSGIRDNTITYQDGRFVDSMGRYTNSQNKNKSKDHYGLMANYIHSLMGKSPEYIPESERKKMDWGNTATTKYFIKDVFNSNKPDYSYFVGLDQKDETTGKRGNEARMQFLSNWIDTNLTGDNFKNKFKGYSEQDYTNTLKYVDEAKKALSDGLDSRDYLAISRLFPGLDWNSLLSTEDETQQDTTEESTEGSSNSHSYDDFVAWVEENYPRYKGNLQSNVSLNSTINYGQWTKNQFINQIKSTQNSNLTTTIFKLLKDKSYQPSIKINGKAAYYDHNWGTTQILKEMRSRGMLQQVDQSNPDLYYIPGSVSSKTWTGWIWDAKNNTVTQKSIHDIPQLRDKIWAKYSGTEDHSGYSAYQLYFKKEGGVLKAQQGTKLWYSGLQDFDPSKYTYQYDTSRLVNGDMSDNNFDPWISNKPGVGVGRYLPSEGNSMEYTKKIEQSPYYQKFGNNLIDENGNFTQTGAEWAKMVDANLPKGSTASFFDENGNVRQSWTVNNQDVYNRSPKTFNALKDYVNYVRNDQILGARHNVFLNQGNRYFYKDSNGVEHWVDPTVAQNYNVTETPVRSSWNDDNTVFWNDYELTGLLENPEGAKKGSFVNPVQDKLKDKPNISGIIGDLSADLISSGRLFAALRNNQKVKDTLLDSTKPVIYNTYELHSPIVGDYGQVQKYNRQAADVRRQAARPMTSDASLQLAGQLDANRQASQYEQQGQLIDNKTIEDTRQQALQRVEDNIKRRSDLSNKNRESIINNIREKGQIKSSYYTQNWQSVDNFLRGIEERLRTTSQENRDRRNQFRLQVAQDNALSDYQDAVSKANQMYASIHPGSTTSDMVNDPKYVQVIRDLQKLRQANIYKQYADIYNEPYQNKYLTTSVGSILNGLYKNGGQLKPSSMYLINKVIRNENNS